MRRLALAAAIALGLTAHPAKAEMSATVQAITDILREQGFQAQIGESQHRPAVAALIRSSAGGVTVNIGVIPCKASSDEVCALIFSAHHPDGRNHLNEATLATLNSALSIAKARRVRGRNGEMTMTLVHHYIWKESLPTALVGETMRNFSADVTRALSVYNGQ